MCRLIALITKMYMLLCVFQGAPTFVQPPVSQSVIKGQGLVLICLVQGDPEPEITWLFNGMPVTDGAYTTTFRFVNICIN